jgi:hypothetical protein
MRVVLAVQGGAVVPWVVVVLQPSLEHDST